VVVSPETGQVQEASIFVAVLGASNYTYAEATWKRDLAAWIGSHVRALEFFGRVFPTDPSPTLLLLPAPVIIDANTIARIRIASG